MALYLPTLQRLLTKPLASQPNVALALIARLIAIVVMVTFSIMVVRGLYFGNQGWTEIKAKVVGNEAHSSNPTVYTPIYTYSFNGQEYARHEGLIAKDKQYVIGSEVPILVNQDDPSEIRQQGNTRLWTLVLLGVILIPCVIMTARTIVEIMRSSKARP